MYQSVYPRCLHPFRGPSPVKDRPLDVPRCNKKSNESIYEFIELFCTSCCILQAVRIKINVVFAQSTDLKMNGKSDIYGQKLTWNELKLNLESFCICAMEDCLDKFKFWRAFYTLIFSVDFCKVDFGPIVLIYSLFKSKNQIVKIGQKMNIKLCSYL